MHKVDAAPSADQWPDTIFAHFQRVGVRQVGYVPDAGHTRLIQRCIDDPAIADVVLTTEEEGVGLVVGAALGSQRAALLMQSSGVGNCINMLSLIRAGGFPFLMLVSMRGDFGESIRWQYAMGQAVEPTVQAMGMMTLRVDRPEDVLPTVSAAMNSVFGTGHSVAVLLTQKLLGAKKF